ncbi:MAG: hypothetical protein ABIQ00_21230 [Chitinophagaceae bacterium]
MKIEKTENKIAVIIFTVITFGFAFYTQVIWAIVATSKSHILEDPVQTFLYYFPPFLRNIATITYVTLLCSIATIILSSAWIKRDKDISKIIGVIILIIAILITLLTLFQLM